MKYISTQVVEAVPMTADGYAKVKQGAFHYSGESRNGYQITKEETGVTEWVPASWFEFTHKAIDMTFGMATEAMEQGLDVRLPCWQAGVFYQSGSTG